MNFVFTRPGTWDYPSLNLRVTEGDVLELDAKPDNHFEEVSPKDDGNSGNGEDKGSPGEGESD